MKMKLRWLAALLLSSAIPAAAQFSLRGGVSGTITDTAQAVVPNATVVLTDLDRNQTFETTTNERGIYSFANLNTGRYQLAASAAGFRKSISAVVQLGSQQSLGVDLELQVGQVTESVQVTASAPLLEAQQSAVGQTINRTFVENLPVKGRNFTAFAVLAPNISTYPRGNSGGTWAVGGHHLIGGVNYVAGGGGDNGFYMNGVNINDNWVGGASYAPSLEAVAEVKVDVAGFSAANGRDISTLNLSTRGGTNQFHGTAFNFFQNSALNAWHPIQKAQAAPGQKMNVLQRNQFGGNFGGPVRIPKIYDGKDRAFFFANYEDTRENRQGANLIFRVPTEAERQGDFSDLLRRFPGDPNYVLWDPFSTTIDATGNSRRIPIPNNDLRGVRRNQDAMAMLAMFPMPNGYVNPSNPADLRNYRTFGARGQQNYRIDTRFDYRISNNDNVYVNYSRSRGLDRNFGGLIPELVGNVEDNSYLVTVNYARVFTPNLTNEFIFAKGRGQAFNVDTKTRAYMQRTDTLRNQFFKNIGVGEDLGYHRIQFAGNNWSSVGYYEVFMASNPTLQFSDNLSWVRGGHSMKFGFNYFRKQQFDWDYIRNVRFDNTRTRAGSLDARRGGDAMASFLMGLPASMEQRYVFTGGQPDLNLIAPYWGFFAEDRWQVTPRLTLSLGLRYDLSIPLYSGNSYGNAIIDFKPAGWELMIPGRAPGLERGFAPQDKNNFAPRISLAYRATNSIVLRASYGLFYQAGLTQSGGAVMGAAFGSVPGYVGDLYDNARFDRHDDEVVLQFGDIFPAPKQFALGTYPVSTGQGRGYFDYPASVQIHDAQSPTVPYFQRYMVEVQKGLGSTMAATVSYLGGRGTKLPYYENANLPAYRTGWNSEDDFNDARPNNTGRFADVQLLRHGLNSFYNSVTAKIERRLSAGLQFVAHYTFSKTVADTSPITTEALGFGTPIWYWNRKLSRGEAEFSHPHRFVSGVTWQMPLAQSMPRAARFLLGGWTANIMTLFESGNALTIYNGISSARDWEPDMPNVSGNPNLPRGQRGFYQWFNVNAFSAPPQDVKGNAGLGLVRGPGINNWDVSLAKSFRPTERARIEFRGELFNAFNHTQWSGVNTSLSDAQNNTFGWITGAREPRVTQLGLRILF